MIKRYILHIEVHRRYRPRISFKRAPRPGDRVVDGGIPGTLKRCPTCQEGFLHEPDPRPRSSWPKSSSRPPLLGVLAAELAKSIHQGRAQRVRPTRSYHTPRPAMDLNAPRHVDLKLTDPEPETIELRVVPPAEHVELKIEDDKTTEHVELKIEDESPEELELDYTLGQSKHKHGDVLWTHKAEYVVDKLEDKILYLVRKDVWDARAKKAKKKAKHVELKPESEHVELKIEEEKPSEVVRLTFD